MKKSAAKNCATADPEIGGDGGVVFGLALFFVGCLQ